MHQPALLPAAVIIAVVAGLVQILKPFVPTALAGDRRDSAVRLLAIGLGAVLEVLYLLLNTTVVGQALMVGAGAGFSALLGYHTGGALLGAVRQAPVAQTTVAPATAVPAVAPAFPPIANDPLQKVG